MSFQMFKTEKEVEIIIHSIMLMIKLLRFTNVPEQKMFLVMLDSFLFLRQVV